MRILSGVQPSGKLHLGNYYGALRQFVSYQDRGEALYFIADLHALTTVRCGADVRAHTRDVALDYLALGLDPDRAIIWRQSDVSWHAELAWILGTLTPMALLERAHSYKDKVARGLTAEAGLFFYPVLMAADILLYRPDCVPVGHDQKQHLEIARDLCTKFNSTYVEGFNPQFPEGSPDSAPGILKLPEPMMVEQAATVPGLDGQKMSKSYDNTIELFADDKAVRKKIMSIKTDSTPVEDPKPEPAALLDLLTIMAPAADVETLRASWRTGGTGYGTYKKQLVEVFFATFAAARARRAQLAHDPLQVEEILQRGAERARAVAAPVYQAIAQAVGCGTASAGHG